MGPTEVREHEKQCGRSRDERARRKLDQRAEWERDQRERAERLGGGVEERESEREL